VGGKGEGLRGPKGRRSAPSTESGLDVLGGESMGDSGLGVVERWVLVSPDALDIERTGDSGSSRIGVGFSRGQIQIQIQTFINRGFYWKIHLQRCHTFAMLN